MHAYFVGIKILEKINSLLEVIAHFLSRRVIIVAGGFHCVNAGSYISINQPSPQWANKQDMENKPCFPNSCSHISSSSPLSLSQYSFMYERSSSRPWSFRIPLMSVYSRDESQYCWYEPSQLSGLFILLTKLSSFCGGEDRYQRP